MTETTQKGTQAKKASKILATLTTKEKNNYLRLLSEALLEQSEWVLEENQKDILVAKENGMGEGMLDRLHLTQERLEDIALGVRKIIDLEDPIGLVEKMWINEDGLKIGIERVPLGVIGMIYESRPNVTIDAAALCFKSGNAVILRGGKEAIYTNRAFEKIMQETLETCGLPCECIQLIHDTTRASTQEMFTATEILDCLIPRGSASLIQAVKREARVPVIETGVGNCHVYIDEFADIEMGLNIVENAKTQRISVCNSMETLVVHEKIAPAFLPKLEERLAKYSVELRADEKAGKCLKHSVPATEEDYKTEFLDYILAIKTVGNLDEAIEHINYYSSSHSEAIVTENYTFAQKFLKEIDSAAVYVNASTRFTDGFVFGFGAEIGISTQKLHARGPMGLPALTSQKYIIYGNGQIRG
ncbi:glutamate-5-semialdehyde dehydrogenase [Pilibacter termitis]|uniref:Gamma-glutamyl phosphate reductase n=1 Tax=Pilibacter termitis TaxID=263852 RepID=A0A1T4MR95_9ENTE|nr:glutamate-5-semialdehyde dehydrogenase [Pilibacter termitis]SJZ69248.1 glutamate-5-semialdehyde dehydrogenase [Pilibacter termitis]